MLLYNALKYAYDDEVTEDEDFDDEFENVYRGTLTEEELARLDKADFDWKSWKENGK